MLRFLISLGGLGAGAVVGMLAAEELASGKKYVHWLQKALFFLLLAAMSYGFFISGKLLLLGGTLAAGITAIFFSWNKATLGNITATYLCALIFSALSSPDSYPLLASLIFLYGLPVGTLLWHQTLRAH